MRGMTPEAQAALERYLMAMADDELVVGYRDTEWTGVAPMLEEDIAFSSIGQDEVGHARLYYSLLHDLTGTMVDYRSRRPQEYRHAQLLEQPSAPRYSPEGDHTVTGDFAYALARQFLYDRFDAERLEALRASSWEPLAQAVDKVRREEKYHLQHTETWFHRLAAGGSEPRARLERVLDRIWPDALGLFESVEGEEALVAEDVIAASSEQLRDRWLEGLAPAFERHGLALPARRTGAGGWEPAVTPRLGGRQGIHTPDWEQMWDEMTSVYRLDPAATW
jgi:ring-1,2-phenylacetyl-CoA epoxidase subunit PaaC